MAPLEDTVHRLNTPSASLWFPFGVAQVVGVGPEPLEHTAAPDPRRSPGVE